MDVLQRISDLHYELASPRSANPFVGFSFDRFFFDGFEERSKLDVHHAEVDSGKGSNEFAHATAEPGRLQVVRLRSIHATGHPLDRLLFRRTQVDRYFHSRLAGKGVVRMVGFLPRGLSTGSCLHSIRGLEAHVEDVSGLAPHWFIEGAEQSAVKESRLPCQERAPDCVFDRSRSQFTFAYSHRDERVYP